MLRASDEISGENQPTMARFTLHYLIFIALGLFCSYIMLSGISNTVARPSIKEFHLESVRDILQRTNCSLVKQENQVSPSIRDFMTTKLRYQFEVNIVDEMAIGEDGHCRAKKVCCSS